MFYLFHHMPKCGGTSFAAFLRSVFRVHSDYVGADHQQERDKFEAYIRKPLELGSMTPKDCVIGHYNLRGIFLPERYPHLTRLEHRKFSILRDPFEAAESGIRYGIMQGWLAPDMSESQRIDLLLRRANYFSRVFGVTSKDQIENLFSQYWFIAPLDRMEHVMRIIEGETGKQGNRPTQLNQTKRPQEPSSPNLVEAFYERSTLDYVLYDQAKLRFGAFSAQALAG